VREIAERLRAGGLRVWFDGPGSIEEGLGRSRALVLCLSANAFGPDWAQLESQTRRFRDPLNQDRRFIPLRLDDAPVKESLAQFLAIEWQGARKAARCLSAAEDRTAGGRAVGAEDCPSGA